MFHHVMNSNIKQADRFDTISNNQSLSGEQAVEPKTKLVANNGYSCQQILPLTRRYSLDTVSN